MRAGKQAVVSSKRTAVARPHASSHPVLLEQDSTAALPFLVFLLHQRRWLSAHLLQNPKHLNTFQPVAEVCLPARGVSISQEREPGGPPSGLSSARPAAAASPGSSLP